MKTKRATERFRSRRGGAMVEFALVFPFLLVLCLAAGDFGRLFFHGVTVANAASSGSHYGSLNNGFAAQPGKIQDRAQKDAGDLSGVTTTATQYCDCPPADASDFTSDPTVVSCDLAAVPGACAGGSYSLPRVYVRTDVSQTFRTVGPYPSIPELTVVNGRAYMRVQ
ncbi:MAG TPA: TadE/TadG family type IV pilus assembly protein [Bryobacterales bacterium]|nr:TadE/TadG family type IV pilus assembly protein [Bryobacterales bacterium]